MLVHTTHGLLERDLLTVSDIVSDEENARVTATEWRLGDELVRRDVHVNLLRGLPLSGEQGQV